MCVVTWLARPYRGDKSTLFFLIFPLLLTNPEKWGQFSNPSNQVCLRAGRSCWLRGKERGRERRWGVKKDNTSAYCTHTHTHRLNRADGWHSVFKVGFQLICASSCTFYESLPPWFLFFFLVFCSLATYESCSNTTCFLWHPWGALSNLSTVVVSLLPSFSSSFLFIYSWTSILLLIVLQRIWVGFVSALLGLYIEPPVLNHVLTNTHSGKHPLRCCESVSGVGAAHTCRRNMCHTCLDHRVMIIGLSGCKTRVENVCVTFHLAWKIPSGERKRERRRQKEKKWEKQCAFHKGQIVHWL